MSAMGENRSDSPKRPSFTPVPWEEFANSSRKARRSFADFAICCWEAVRWLAVCLWVQAFDFLKDERVTFKQITVVSLIAFVVIAAVFRFDPTRVTQTIQFAPASATGPKNVPRQFSYTLRYEPELETVFLRANDANEDVLKDYGTFERACDAVGGKRLLRVRWVGERLTAGASEGRSAPNEFPVITINEQNFKAEWKPVLKKIQAAILAGNRSGGFQVP